MSHTAVVEIVVLGMGGLLQAVTECGLDVIQEKRFATDDGKVHEVDVVVQEGEARVGISLDAKTGVASFIAHDCKGKQGKALANKIAQRYARSRVIAELEAKGYQLGKEVVQKDGTIKLVASRWK